MGLRDGSYRSGDVCRNAASRLAFATAVACATLFIAAPVAAQLTLNWTASVSTAADPFTPAALQIDAAGNVYLAGELPGYYVLRKYASSGMFLWERRSLVVDGAGSCGYFVEPGLALDSSGNVVLRHRKYSPAAGDCTCALTKFNAAGDQLWTATSPNPCFELTIDASDDIDVASSGEIEKYSKDGVRRWSSSIPVSYGAYSFGIAGHSDGSVYVLSNDPDWENDDIVVYQYDANGNQGWTARYNGGDFADDWPGHMILDAAGNVYVMGYSDMDGEEPGGSPDHVHDVVTMKITPAGVIDWCARYSNGQLGYDRMDLWYDPWEGGIAFDPSGNIVVTGRIAGGTATRWNFVTLKYSSGGTELWNAGYNGPISCDDQASDVAVSSTGNIYVVGASEDSCPDGAASLVMIQYAAGGAVIAQDRLAGSSYIAAFNDGLQEARITLAPQGSAYVLIGTDLRKYACVALTPPTATPNHLAIDGSIGVLSHGGCAGAWTATSNAAWLTVTSGSSGSGNGTVGYHVTANTTGESRTGVITIGDANFILTQDFDPCALTTPSGLAAVPWGDYGARLTWVARPGVNYEVQRRSASSIFMTVSTTASSPFVESFLGFEAAYLYRVRAVSSCGTTPFTNTDVLNRLASYTDEPLVAGSTVVKAVHITELRSAIDAVRWLALLPSATYGETPAAGAPVKPAHILEMRANLDAALAVLGATIPSYTDSTLASGGTVIRKAHIQQLRDAAR